MARRPPTSSSMLQFDLLGLPEFRQWAKKAPKKLDAALRASMHASVLLLKSEVQNRLHDDVLQRRTGNYYRRISTEVKRQRGAWVGIVGTDVIYARVHEFGATIRPKSKKGWLRFQIDGRWVQTKQVKIPKRPVWVPAFKSSRDRILRIHRNQIDRMMQESQSTAIGRLRTRRLTRGSR